MGRKGHFCLFNCLVLGNIKYGGVQRIYSEPFSKRLFHSRNRQDFVLVRPGIMPGEFVLSPDSVYYCRVQLLFSFSSMTDTGVQPFDCALVSVLEPYEGPLASGNYFSDIIDYFLFLILIPSLHRLGTGRRVSYFVRAGSDKAPWRS